MTAPRSALGTVAKIVSCAMLAYWGLYAAVTPVTNVDSQIYNIARIELAARGGFFNNGMFGAYHVMFPWTFDALHLPFVVVGWGYALPSFLCLIGTCFIAFTLIKSKYGSDAAWVAILGLLGLTCLVYQGTSTKNDIPIIFCGATWIYARWRWKREVKNRHLVWMVLAIGFMAGSKTTGALYGIILACWNLWELRSNKKFAIIVMAGFAGSFVFLGSVETYIESARRFGHPLGPPTALEELKNVDGVGGGVANLTRHITGSIYVGPVNSADSHGIADVLTQVETKLLTSIGLVHAGIHPKYRDKPHILFQSGFEELSGFGPVGTIAMGMMLAACLFWRPKALWWKLAATGFVGILLVSITVSYTDWMKRYLIGWYALGTIAAVCALWETQSRRRQLYQWGFGLIALASAVAAPALSFNRGPLAIIAAVTNRDQFETCNYPLIGKVRERLRVLRSKNPNSHIYYIVCDSSLILPIIEDPVLDAILVTPTQSLALAARGLVVPGDLIIVDALISPQSIPPIEEVSAPNIFENNRIITQAIYQIPFSSMKSSEKKEEAGSSSSNQMQNHKTSDSQ